MTQAQTIFVTGASSGVGRATAALFAHRGWNVAATRKGGLVGNEKRDSLRQEEAFVAAQPARFGAGERTR